ncbi:multifunctional protein ADE2 [Trichuris trichiura]|uniref:Multifunctional protein ADE2 n=1 Tax=Trichuris trichiura TaxID=36087 RepID=A0A077ZCJ9_TRITR|nr:multifunctional protein ADE2 [Trichuris trichiura]
MENCSKIADGKTKTILTIPDSDYVLVQSKDRITAFNAERQHDLEGKAHLSNVTTSLVFQYLNSLGLKTHFVKMHSNTEFIALRCVMIPIEWVARRLATGSFLKRNPNVSDGYRFSPPKVELFYKDDSLGDPEWSRETLIESGLVVSGVTIHAKEVDFMIEVTRTVFEILERAWDSVGCTLVDMKVEFGVHAITGNIILADVIDSDSWRLWPGGDKSLQVDKQFYRDLPIVTEEDLSTLIKKFSWVVEQLKNFTPPARSRVVVFMGSDKDSECGEMIRSYLQKLGIHCDLRVASAHKGTVETLKILAEYEGDLVPTVFIAVAGRSNGLGPILSGNTSYPVINCPPVEDASSMQDVWSSLRMPSGIGCVTVLNYEAAALHAANVLALHDHYVWSRLRVNRLLNYISLMKADSKSHRDNDVKRDLVSRHSIG